MNIGHLFRCGAISLGILAVAAAPAATIGFVEDFNGGTGGFGGGTAIYENVVSGGVGGAGDGYLRMANEQFAAPLGGRSFAADLTGDLSGVTGFSFWLNDLGSDEGLEVYLGVGQGQFNYWQFNTGFAPGNNAWSEFSVDLTDESQWTQIIGGGTFADALANHDRLRFRYDAPPIDQTPPALLGDFGLDRITVLPEPSTLLAIALGLLAVAPRRR